MKLRKILVPLDGSELAEGALPEAIDLCGTGATLVLLRATEATRLRMTDATEAQVAVVEEAQTYLDGVAERARKAGVATVETTVWYAPPGEAIVEAARLRDIDLIVMNTHGRSGLGRLVMGSVADTVLRGTTTPILLVRARQAPLAPVRAAAAPAPREDAHV